MLFLALQNLLTQNKNFQDHPYRNGIHTADSHTGTLVEKTVEHSQPWASHAVTNPSDKSCGVETPMPL